MSKSRLCVTLSVFMLAINVSSVSASTLAEQHIQKSLTCAACHTDVTAPAKADEKACQRCHGTMDAMGEKSEGKFEVNPHAPHGAKVSCLQCHHGHKAQENYCNKCHEFNFKRTMTRN